MHTRSGVALIANDMHLDLGVPAVWYPARLRVTGESAAGRHRRDAARARRPWRPAPTATSPGASPTATAISPTCASGQVREPRLRRAPRAHRGDAARDAVEVEYRDAGAGVVLDGEEYADDVARGECLQAAWLATRPEATNFGLLGARNARAASTTCWRSRRSVGIPGQNLVIGDAGRAHRLDVVRPRAARHGAGSPVRRARISRRAWIIRASPIRRSGGCGPRTSAWSMDRSRRVLGDDEVDVGAGGYDIGARARQIRDGLLGLAHPATEADMLAIQLDSRALFVARWRDLLLALHRRSSHARRRRCAANSARWSASGSPRPAPDAVGYRLVRDVSQQDAGCAVARPRHRAVRREGRRQAARPSSRPPGWRLVNERPPAIAPPGGDDWRAFLLRELDATIEAADRRSAARSRPAPTAAADPVAVRHPLSRAVPVLVAAARHADARTAGDHHMPRVQDGAFGASERFAVSPGREADGILELPGGPSGHPLSPFYRSGFEDWAAGKPTPFLPGPAAHKLVLRPYRAAAGWHRHEA